MINALLELYSIVLPVLGCLLLTLWLASLQLRDASIIDIFWGPGFVVLNTATLAILPGEITDRQWLVHTAVTLWGLRLGIHLFVRNAGHGEDSRYRRWRETGGSLWWFASLYRVYLFQGIIMLIVSLPVVLVNLPDPQPELGVLDYLGFILWLAGFVIETGSDQQLALFKQRPDSAKRVLDTGFWRYSVHPNYFGDAAQWWGIWLMVAATPLGLWAVASPLLMTLVLVRISSGLLERALQRKKPGYADYVQRTGRFFPRPPRTGAQTDD